MKPGPADIASRSSIAAERTWLAKGVFENYQRSLHKFLLRRLPSAQDASDVAQEIFLRLLRIERADLIRNPRAYLYGIASHVVRDFRERARRERVRFDSDEVNLMTENPRHSDTSDLADALSFERQLERAATHLSAVELRILVYDRCDGLTHEQIAGKLGLSTHTVKKYFFRALAIVRTSLSQDESER